MKCFFGGASLRKEYLLEENAMLQRMLLQEQRAKLDILQELHDERTKCSVLEQEIAQVAAAAQEMGENLAQYIHHRSSDTQPGFGSDQRPYKGDQHGPFSSPFPPAPMSHLQCIPEHAHKQQQQQGMLDLAEQVRDFAAGMQQRLAHASAPSTPRGAAAATGAARGATAGGTFGRPAAPAGTFEQDMPCPAHSTSVGSAEHPPGCMDLPSQALAVSRLALQLHQTQGPSGEETSGFSSSGMKSSCTVLGASMDLTSSIGSFRSYGNNQHAAAGAQQAGMLEPLLSATEPELSSSRQQRASRTAANRCSVTRGAAAIAGSCASIAAAAAATAAAAAAKKAAIAAALADAAQPQGDLRFSTESGLSSMRSSVPAPGSLSASVKQRQQWQQAQEQWDLQQATQEQQQQEEQEQQHGSSTSSRWGFPADAMAQTTGGNSSRQDSAGPMPCSAAACSTAGAPGQHSSAEGSNRLSVQPPVPSSHLAWPQHMQEPYTAVSQQQQQSRYGSAKLTSAMIGGQQTEHGMSAAPQHSAASFGSSRPPLRPQQHMPAQPSAAGPLHRNLASLGVSSNSSAFRHAPQQA